MPTITITTTGGPRIAAKLARREGATLNGILRKATREGANAAKPFIVAEAPRKTGETARSVSVRGTRELGASVGPRIWRRHFNIRGTRRGVEPNPWVARGAQRAQTVVAATFSRNTSAEVNRG